MKVKILSRNVRGVNDLEKRKVIRNFIRSQRVDLVCLQETKIQGMNKAWVHSIGVGRFLDWKALDAEGFASSCCSGIKEDYLWWSPSLAAILFLVCSVWWRMISYGCLLVCTVLLKRDIKKSSGETLLGRAQFDQRFVEWALVLRRGF